MRMYIYLWIGLTLVLGICGDDVAKRAAEDGSGSGDGLPITDGRSDDEDYSASSYISASVSDYESDGGSGSSSFSESYDDSFTQSEDYSVSKYQEEDNFIKFRGEFTIRGIAGGTLDWMEDLTDTQTDTFREFSNVIVPMVQQALESKKATRKGLQNVSILSYRHGSIITEYEASYSQDSTVTADNIRRSLKDAISTNNFGKLEVDPRSVSLVTKISSPQGVIVTDQPATTTPKPVKTTMIATTSITSSVSANEQHTTRSHKTKTDPPKVPTTQIIVIDETTEPYRKPDPDPITLDDTIEPDPDHEFGDNKGRGDGGDPEKKEENFWDKLFSHPLILAGLVGAVVIALLTVVLLLMFIVYRIKKKDEGSYSLDEPHKVKDPMAYWKDTKEFYA